MCSYFPFVNLPVASWPTIWMRGWVMSLHLAKQLFSPPVTKLLNWGKDFSALMVTFGAFDPQSLLPCPLIFMTQHISSYSLAFLLYHLRLLCRLIHPPSLSYLESYHVLLLILLYSISQNILSAWPQLLGLQMPKTHSFIYASKESPHTFKSKYPTPLSSFEWSSIIQPRHKGLIFFSVLAECSMNDTTMQPVIQVWSISLIFYFCIQNYPIHCPVLSILCAKCFSRPLICPYLKYYSKLPYFLFCNVYLSQPIIPIAAYIFFFSKENWILSPPCLTLLKGFSPLMRKHQNQGRTTYSGHYLSSCTPHFPASHSLCSSSSGFFWTSNKLVFLPPLVFHTCRSICR